MNFTGKRQPRFDVVLEDTRFAAGILVVNEIRINGRTVMLPRDSKIDIHVEPTGGVTLALTVFPTSVTIRPSIEEPS